MITLGICDDDEKMLEYLREKIEKKFPEMNICTFLNPEDLENFIKNRKNPTLDILIMDIVFENENGIRAAKRIQKIYPKIQLIYLTGFIDYARDIFETDPIYFLVKPIEENRLYDALSRAIRNCKEKESRYMMIQMKSGVYKVYYDDVIYVESEKRNIHIHMNNQSITYINQLTRIEKQFPKEFLRIHQSYLVNMDYISALEKNEIRLTTGKILPVSRHRGMAVKEKFLRYIGEQL